MATTLTGCDPRIWVMCGLGLCGSGNDVYPPDVPRELEAHPGAGQVTLVWPASSGDTDSYEVWAAGPGQAFKMEPSEVDHPNDGRNLRYVDEDLTNGDIYRYYLRAVDGAGNRSDPSSEVSATPTLDPGPSPLIRPPLELSATARSGAVDLSWSASEGARYYHVYRRDTTPGAAYSRIKRATLETTYTDPTVAPGASYQYVVTAEDFDGNESAYSRDVLVTVPGGAPPLLLTFGTQGNGRGQFEEPVGVATNADGDIFVVDRTLENVQMFDANGDWQTTFGVDGDPCMGGLTLPSGIDLDAGGNVYVTDAAGCVQRFNPQGIWLNSFGSHGADDGEFIGPDDVAVDADGNSYVTDDMDRVQKFSTIGTFLTKWSLNSPFGVATGADGVYVTSPGAPGVNVFTFTGSPVRSWGSDGTANGQFRLPFDIDIDPDGQVYVVDTGNRRVQGFTSTGAFGTLWGGFGGGSFPDEGPQGVATDCHGNVYVADTHNFRIQKFGDPTAPSVPCPGITGLLSGGGGLDRAPFRRGPAPSRRSPAARPAATQGFQARFTATSGQRGTYTATSGRTLERGARQRGSFRFKPTGRRRGALRGLPLSAMRGRWGAVYGVTANLAAATGRATGTMLATLKNRRAGRLCLRFSVSLRVTGQGVKTRGTFATLGGTGAAATTDLRGRYTQSAGRGDSWTIRGTAVTRQRAKKALPRQCRRAARGSALP